MPFSNFFCSASSFSVCSSTFFRAASTRFVLDSTARAELVREEGGVQPYVLWLGAALHVLMMGLLVAAISEGPPEGDLLEGSEERLQPKFF